MISIFTDTLKVPISSINFELAFAIKKNNWCSSYPKFPFLQGSRFYFLYQPPARKPSPKYASSFGKTMEGEEKCIWKLFFTAIIPRCPKIKNPQARGRRTDDNDRCVWEEDVLQCRNYAVDVLKILLLLRDVISIRSLPPTRGRAR